MNLKGMDMVEKIFDLIKENLKNPKLYIILFIVLIIILLLFPYIDANFFYYNRVEKRVAILKEVLEIEQGKVEDNSILKAEYDSILNEIEKQKEGSLGSVFRLQSSNKEKCWKFVTGALVSIVLAILCLFIKLEKKWQKIVGVLFFILVGAGLGYVSMIIPTVITPKCNYFLMPLLQLTLFGLLATYSNKREKK